MKGWGGGSVALSDASAIINASSLCIMIPTDVSDLSLSPLQQLPPETGPIDAVITWVDGNDPAHHAKLSAYLQTLGRTPASAAPTRFRSVGELDYCIASLLKFAPFLRRIHVVTDHQRPSVFDRAAHWPAAWRDKLVLVDHTVIFQGFEDCLPSFNSRSIESLLHRIPGLAEQFVYLNDDFVLIKPVQPLQWFDHGQPVIRGRWRRIPEQRLDRRIRRWWQDLRGVDRASLRPSHLDAQALAARLAGYDERFFEHDHHPHPLRRSTLESFFEANPQVLRRNVTPRLRDASQFLSQMLAGHLELKQGSAKIAPAGGTLNLKAAGMSLPALRQRLERARSDPSLQFVCLQSLDEASEDAQQAVMSWLDSVMGGVEPVPVANLDKKQGTSSAQG
jgi:hypothetical protein